MIMGYNVTIVRCSVAAETTCDVDPPSERVNCGYPGITKEACSRKDCCWDTGVRDVPWCYRRVPVSTTAVTTEKTTTEIPEPNCDVGAPSTRKDCGYPGIPQSVCHERNCCWNDTIHGVPWCFLGKGMTRPTQGPEPNCDVGAPSTRKDCGYPGIPQSLCHERNCCWNDTIRDVPWCFFGKGMTMPTQEPEPNCDVGHPSKRVDCGYPGIPDDVCRERGCCWDKSIANVPWCFFGVYSTTGTSSSTSTPRSTSTGTSSSTATTQAPCDVQPSSRKQCGQRTITRNQCINKGCCWELSSYHSVPSCYYVAPKPNPSGCDPDLPNRRPCGYVGLNEYQCAERGCCWDDSVYGRRKCYRPNAG